MRRRAFVWVPLIVLLALAGCDAADEFAAPRAEEEVNALVELLDLPGELLISSTQERFVEEFEPAATGTTPGGLHWGILSPEEAHTLYLGMAFGQVGEWISGRKVQVEFSVEAATGCIVDSGLAAGRGRSFADCLASRITQCDIAWTWKEDNGKVYAEGMNMPENERGELVLSDCQSSDPD